MFYHLHCVKCHHEWDSYIENDICDWCGADSYVLASANNWFLIMLGNSLLSVKGKIKNEKKEMK